MCIVLENARACLKDSGKLLIRDYGFCDMSQIRFINKGSTGYERGDGTLSYYFKIDELVEMMESSGFTVEECYYVCVNLKNRKNQKEMKRVFVHGVFKSNLL